MYSPSSLPGDVCPCQVDARHQWKHCSEMIGVRKEITDDKLIKRQR
jgi:hypothetical protein